MRILVITTRVLFKTPLSRPPPPLLLLLLLLFAPSPPLHDGAVYKEGAYGEADGDSDGYADDPPREGGWGAARGGRGAAGLLDLRTRGTAHIEEVKATGQKKKGNSTETKLL